MIIFNIILLRLSLLLSKLAAHTGELLIQTCVCFYLVNALCSFQLDELEHKCIN